jgi:hypothetical protein
VSWLERWRGLEWAPPFGAGWLLVLLIGLAVAYSIFIYRRNEAPLDARTRGLLAGLRAAALVLLLLILSRPVLSVALPSGASKGVLVLLDRSESLGLPGRTAGTTRLAEAARAVEQIRSQLSGKYPLSIRPFAAEVGAPLDLKAPLPPGTGEATDLGRALEVGGAGAAPLGKPGAIILISDGTATSGTDPVPVARRLGIPVETVKLGSPDPVPDLAVSRIRANLEAFAGEPTPVDALVRLQGLDPVTVPVEVLDVTDGRTLMTETRAPLAPGGAETKVSLSFVPTKVGLRFFEVRVPSLPGEAAAANNRRVFAMDVREEKTGVLLLSGDLTWDHTFIRRALEDDSTLTVLPGVRRDNAFQPAGGKRALPALDAAGLRTVRVVVLDHVSSGQLSRGALEALAVFVRSGGGLVMITGGQPGDLNQWQGTALGALLPAEGGSGGTEQEESVQLAPAAHRHVLFDPSVPGAPSLDAWRDLPPLAVTPDVRSIKAGGEALLTDARNLPVLSWNQVGQGRVMLWAAGGIWRWQFMAGSHGPGASTLPPWWRRAAHWLARPTVEGQVDIRPEKPVVPRGQSVTFTARVSDENYRPLADASVEVTITPTDTTHGATPTRVTLAGNQGFFTGGVGPLPPGHYRYRGRAHTPRTELPPTDGLFVVDSLGVETERLEADHELLERIASASGGHVWAPDSLRGIGGVLSEQAAAREERAQVVLWDHPLVFAVFVLLVSLEWLLRRRRGLV